MQNKLFDKTKIVLNGVLISVIFILAGLGYSYYTFDESLATKSAVLDGKFFKILKTFRDEKINFADLPSMLNTTFANLQDTRVMVNPDTGNGRINPFAK